MKPNLKFFLCKYRLRGLLFVFAETGEHGLYHVWSNLNIYLSLKMLSAWITVLVRSHNRIRRPQPRAISSFKAVPMIWDNFSSFLEQIAPSPAAHVRTFCEDFCARNVAQGKWRPKFPKSFMLLAKNSTLLWLLEFYLSIFVVGFSSSNEIRQCRIYLCPTFFADQLISAALFTRNSYYSTTNSTPEEDFSIT